MKKAFIILAHQLPEQLNVFTEQILSDSDSEVFIHINKLCEDIIPNINLNERIHISKNNVAIHWGSDEVLQALLIMMKEVLDCNKTFEYVIICTGQDLLVNNGLDDFLNTNYGKVIIDVCKAKGDFYNRYVRARLLYKWPEIYRRKYDFRYHPFRIMRAVRYRYTLSGKWPFSKKKIDYDVSNMTFFKDWYWSAIPLDVVSFIINFMNQHPTYWSIYKNGYLPEEGFITTLLWNYGMKDRLLDKTMTYIKPMRNNHPPIFTVSDIDELENCGCSIARKFDIRVDREVIDYFKNKIINSVRK